jgi:hypothetical protein
MLREIDIALLVDEQKFNELDAKKPYGYEAAVVADLMDLLRPYLSDFVARIEAPPAYNAVHKHNTECLDLCVVYHPMGETKPHQEA